MELTSITLSQCRESQHWIIRTARGRGGRTLTQLCSSCHYLHTLMRKSRGTVRFVMLKWPKIHVCWGASDTGDFKEPQQISSAHVSRVDRAVKFYVFGKGMAGQRRSHMQQNVCTSVTQVSAMPSSGSIIWGWSLQHFLNTHYYSSRSYMALYSMFRNKEARLRNRLCSHAYVKFNS